MNNNFNQQAPQQPMYQQAPQQMYQQPMYQPAPKKPINVMELVALICAGVSLVLAILGATLTCACSASKSFDLKDGETFLAYKLSPVFILSIFAILVAIGGIVCGIIAVKQNGAKSGKMALVAVAVSAFALLYAFIPMVTICGYNCSLTTNYEEYFAERYGNINRYR